MAFDDLVRKMVTVANTVSSSLQNTVTHYPASGFTKDGYDKITSLGSGTARSAIVERDIKIQSPSGVNEADERVLQRVDRLTFLTPFAISPADRFVFADGEIAGPVLKIESVEDPDTNRGYYAIVTLGKEE